MSLLRRFWGLLSEAAGGQEELDLRFVMEEVRTVVSLAARTKVCLLCVCVCVCVCVYVCVCSQLARSSYQGMSTR